MGLAMTGILKNISNTLKEVVNPPVEEIGPFKYRPGTLCQSFEVKGMLENSFNVEQLKTFVDEHTSADAVSVRIDVAQRLLQASPDDDLDAAQGQQDYFTLIDEDVVYAQGLLADYEENSTSSHEFDGLG